MSAANKFPPEVIAGRVLYGNDFTGTQLAEWVAAEAKGYHQLASTEFAKSLAEDGHEYAAMNWADGATLRGKSFPVALVLGCADGSDVLALGVDIGRVIAIEPARDWWTDRLGTVPAEFRMPTIDGTIDLPDASVDLAITLGVLHHIANVEFVLAELARVLKPGAYLTLREPISSMGDFSGLRYGLTRHERGIPVALLRQFLAAAGLGITQLTYRMTPGLPELLYRLGKRSYTYGWLVAIDRLISRVLAFNDRYWRDRLWKKLAPRTVSITAQKR